MLEIIEVKNKLGNGCTIPYLAWCNDNNTYVIKFPGNPQSKRALVNEYVCSRLCSLLYLPIVDFQLIKVDIKNYTEETRKDNIKPIIGTAFGTKYQDTLLPVINSNQILKASNNEDSIKILIFDLLVGNYDRNNGNLMIDSKTHNITMIDHTHVFTLGTIWDSIQLKYHYDEKFSIDNIFKNSYELIISGIKYTDNFYKELNEFIGNIKHINNQDIDNILMDLPKDWEVDDSEKASLKEYLLKRFGRVDEIIELLDLKDGGKSE